MRITYGLREIAVSLGLTYTLLYFNLRRDRVPGVKWKKVGAGRAGADYTAEEYELIKQWAENRTVRGKIATTLGRHCGEVVA